MGVSQAREHALRMQGLGHSLQHYVMYKRPFPKIENQQLHGTIQLYTIHKNFS